MSGKAPPPSFFPPFSVPRPSHAVHVHLPGDLLVTRKGPAVCRALPGSRVRVGPPGRSDAVILRDHGVVAAVPSPATIFDRLPFQCECRPLIMLTRMLNESTCSCTLTHMLHA